MTHIIVDTSALLALIKNEPGSGIIEPFLGRMMTSSVVISEAATTLINFKMTPFECQQVLQPLVSSIIPFDMEQAFAVAGLTQSMDTSNLSLSHQACLMLALKMQIPLYTADQQLSRCQIEHINIVGIG